MLLSPRLKRAAGDSSKDLRKRRQQESTPPHPSPPPALTVQWEALGSRSWSNVHSRGESGEQNPAWKNPAPQPGEGRRPRPHCSGPRAAVAAEPQCRAWDPHPAGASRPRRPRSAVLCAARRSPPGRGGKRQLGSRSPPAQRRAPRSILRWHRELTHPALRAGAADSAWPRQVPTHSWRAHPSVRPSRSRRCWQSVRQLLPSVRQPQGSGATSRGGAAAE